MAWAMSRTSCVMAVNHSLVRTRAFHHGIGENKGADQLRGNREADQHLCFRYMDSTLPVLHKSKISSFLPSSVTVQPGLCQTWSKPKLFAFSPTGSFIMQWLTVASLLLAFTHSYWSRDARKSEFRGSHQV